MAINTSFYNALLYSIKTLSIFSTESVPTVSMFNILTDNDGHMGIHIAASVKLILNRSASSSITLPRIKYDRSYIHIARILFKKIM